MLGVRCRSVIVAIVASVSATALPAQVVPGQPAARDTTRQAAPAAPPPSPASPRVALTAFLELTRAGRYGDAAAFLDLPDTLRTHGSALARELKAVLDRHVWFDLDEISGAAVGDTADGLPAGVEQVATIPGPGGTRASVQLVRTNDPEGPAWRFTRSTVRHIPSWYADLGDRWMLDHLPAPLLKPGPLDLLWWQWLALPILVAIAWFLGALVNRIVCAFVGRVTRRTSAEWDDALISRLSGPITFAATLIIAALLLPWLELYAPAAQVLNRMVKAGLFIAFFWALWRLVDVGHVLVLRSAWARQTTTARALLPILSRTAKVAVLAIAAVAVFSTLGYPVAGLITGLGLGGLAFALAAQKTVENFFGAISIGLDQPFREGDFVKIEDFVGTVEAIGLRSTRIRTLDRTIITMPNGKLADMRLESFAVRDRLRFAAVIGLVYETTAAQMRAVLEGFERVLRAQPKLWSDSVTVRFSALSPSSLDIEVMAWFETSDWGEFQGIRQDVLLQFMDVVEQAGTSFAFPTQTIHLASPPAAAPSAST
jgi:MscS family membrane protein